MVQNALGILFSRSQRGVPTLGEIAVLDQRTLSSAFRTQALEMHPDRASALGLDPEELNTKFKRLHAAYRVLCRLVDDERMRDGVLQADSGLSARSSTAFRPGEARAPSGAQPRPAYSHGTEWQRQSEQRFYNGKVPETELRFAQFLYYTRVIDWKTMIDAVTWQYRVRPKVGEIGRSYNFIDFKDVSTVLRQSPRGELFGETALRMGVLDPRQLRVMLGKQYRLNYPIGRYFVEQDILAVAEVEHLLALNKSHNARARRTR